jgi:hypothetical protein
MSGTVHKIGGIFPAGTRMKSFWRGAILAGAFLGLAPNTQAQPPVAEAPNARAWPPAPAESNVSDQDETEMDGVLYLTGQRLLFEEEEKTVLFVGKKKQELNRAVKLSEIESVGPEDRGLFGATQWLIPLSQVLSPS